MANLVIGLGTSHGPLLSLPPELWERSRTADMMEIPLIHFRGKTYSYEELLALREGERDYLAEQFSLENRRQKFQHCQQHLDTMAERLAEAKPDCMIVIGDDHLEYFKKDIQPTFAVCYGEAAINQGFDPASDHGLPEGVPAIISGNRPLVDQAYPAENGLAMAIFDEAMSSDFDLTASAAQPRDADGLRSVGHSVGFIYRRLLKDQPLPLVSVLQNTYFPPNQPSVRRCYEFGRVIGRAIKSWNSDKRVAIAASGGMTHFAIDEEFDRRVLQALQTRDLEMLFAIPEEIFQAGTSEIKNWITVLGALEETGFEMNIIGAEPCYRSEAGTGTFMAFATWS